jgi:hypothetical protein
MKKTLPVQHLFHWFPKHLVLQGICWVASHLDFAHHAPDALSKNYVQYQWEVPLGLKLAEASSQIVLRIPVSKAVELFMGR